MKKYLKLIISSFLAGALIALGATCYLVCTAQGGFGYKIFGSFLFGIGLFTIMNYGLWLFTGKVGYAIDKKINYILYLLICLLFNLIGSFITTVILKATPINDIVKPLCETIVSGKQSEKWYEVIILGFFCGIMIFLAVDGNKRCENPAGKILFAFLPIVLFILCGFEHVVANMCYYTYAASFEAKMVLWFILMAIGDALGSILFYGTLKLITYLKSEEI